MLLSTAYLPPIHYFKKIATSSTVLIEQHEYFVKQTYRNRCTIYGANGVQDLVIPLENTHEKTPIHQKKIAYKQNWQLNHWRSIESAYRNSPYFIYYADELHPFYTNKYEFLLEYNNELLKTLLRLLKLKGEIQLTDVYEKNVAEDLRSAFSPKKPIPQNTAKPYSQVFSEKHGFIPNLSIIDLLFNKGPEAYEYLL